MRQALKPSLTISPFPKRFLFLPRVTKSTCGLIPILNNLLYAPRSGNQLIMPCLNELSNEILYQIIDQIDPADIYKFSHSCSHFRQLTKEALALHEDRKEMYEYTVVQGCNRHLNSINPLQLMYDIYMDWKVGYYVRYLDLQCCNHMPDTQLIPNILLERVFDEEDIRTYKAGRNTRNVLNERFIGLLQGYIVEKCTESGFSHSSRFSIDELCSEARKGDRDAMVRLLLWLLPHLEVLYLSQRGRNSRYLHEAMLTMIAQGHTKSRVCKPLTKLVQVQILGPRHDPIDEHFDDFAPFMALPSMKDLIGAYVRGLFERPVMWAHLPLHASNVTVISFKTSLVSVECFRLMLKAIKSLKEFSYDCLEGDEMEAHKIIAALHEHAKHSLELLWLRGDVIIDAMDEEIPNRPLQEFKVLKKCRIPSSAYLGLWPWRRTFSGDGHCLDDIQPLVHVLPPSIEELSLCFQRTVPGLDHTSGFLDHFAEEKEQRLPLLKSIRIQDYFARFQSHVDSAKLAREMCAKVGVTLKTDWSGYDDGEDFPNY